MILGIDPGFSGALAWYCPTKNKLVAVMPMPVKNGGSSLLSPESKTTKRTLIDGRSLAKAIFAQDTSLVVIEHVTASPQMGVTSAFRFGEGFGAVCGILEALGHTPRKLYPSSWKTALNLSSDKKASVLLACKLFPEWESTFKSGAKSADLAEAALIAYYGLRLKSFSAI